MMLVTEYDSIRICVACPICGEQVWVMYPRERLTGDEQIASVCWKCKSRIRFVMKAWID